MVREFRCPRSVVGRFYRRDGISELSGPGFAVGTVKGFSRGRYGSGQDDSDYPSRGLPAQMRDVIWGAGSGQVT